MSDYLLQILTTARSEWREAWDENERLFNEWVSKHPKTTDCDEYRKYKEANDIYKEKLRVMEDVYQTIKEVYKQ